MPILLSRTLSNHFLHNLIPNPLRLVFPTHVVAPPSLRHTHSVNNHGNLSALYRLSRVPTNSPPHSPSLPEPSPSHSRRRFAAIAFSRLTSSPPSILGVRPARPRAIRFSPFALHPRFSPPASRMFVSTERLSSAWRHTPMKWNPLPWFVGALLLILIQYRRHRSEKEVHVDEDGYEVVKLKGPWQVGVPTPSPIFFYHYCFPLRLPYIMRMSQSFGIVACFFGPRSLYPFVFAG
jgi:hypothetical protein